jgi:hypothetical protein
VISPLSSGDSKGSHDDDNDRASFACEPGTGWENDVEGDGKGGIPDRIYEMSSKWLANKASNHPGDSSGEGEGVGESVICSPIGDIGVDVANRLRLGFSWLDSGNSDNLMPN